MKDRQIKWKVDQVWSHAHLYMRDLSLYSGVGWQFEKIFCGDTRIGQMWTQRLMLASMRAGGWPRNQAIFEADEIHTRVPSISQNNLANLSIIFMPTFYTTYLSSTSITILVIITLLVSGSHFPVAKTLMPAFITSRNANCK